MATSLFRCHKQFWQVVAKGNKSNAKSYLKLINLYGTKQFAAISHLSQSTSGTGIIKQESINEFQRDGVTCIRNYFDQCWLDSVKCGIEQNLKKPSQYHDWLTGKDGKGLYFNDYNNWTNIKEFTEYVYKSPAAKLAGTLMESKISVFFHEHVFVRDGGTDRAAPWHHDQAYYPLDGMQNCSIWMPITPVSKETCLKFVRGSHLWGRWFNPKKFGTHSHYDSVGQKNIERIYEKVPDVEGNNEYEVVSWQLEPGDCIAFHMKTLHGTDKSLSEIPRLVLATRWVGEDAVYSERPWQTSPPSDTMPKDIKIGDSFHASGFPTIWTRKH